MLIAVPSEAPGGLDAETSAHFGHAPAFTLVRLEEGEIAEVTVLENGGHTEGGCTTPVMVLKEHEVSALVAGGMGMRPLAGFQQVGIRVYFNEGAATVREAVERFARGECREFGEAQTCGGGECGGHGHHHREVQREPIEGPADIRDGRVVSFHFVLTEKDGELLESSEGGEPARYLHGHGNLTPGLEKALAGLEPGAHKIVELPAAEAFGEHDASQVFDVPRAKVPKNAVVGDVLHAEHPDGTPLRFIVVALDDDSARLDANHPLAGKDLVFDVTVVSVESATAEELEHGHPH